MRSFIDFAGVNHKNPDTVWIKLHPETEAEKRVIADGSDAGMIDDYYRMAVSHRLPDYELAEFVNKKQWPQSAQVRVRRKLNN